MYDLKSMHMPEDQCEVVLTKDCSALELFMVTIKATETARKHVSLYLPNKLVEVVPVENTIQVKVDGEAIAIPEDGSSHVLYEPETGDEVLRFMPKFNSVFITSWKYGLMLDTDGISFSFKPSELYRGQLCGVCGDFNSDLHHELTQADNTVVRSPSAFISSYTIPTLGCEATVTHTLECERVYRNIVFERYIENEQHVCISVEPVAQCTGPCEPEATVQRNRAFHCLPAYLSAARHLRQDAHNRPLHLDSENVSLHEIVSEHQECLPAF